MNINNVKMSILVLSCDEYSDLWDDFFDFKDKYWPDCPYPTYLVNDTLPYERDGVIVLNAGNGVKWSTRVRKALERIDTPYVCPILDDHFIIRPVDTKHIEELLEFSENRNVSYLAFERKSFILPEDKWEFYASNLVIIPRDLKYGINTSAAIWNKDDYMRLIGPEDYSPWQFEVNMCNLAKTGEGLPGLILFDAGVSLNICEKEVVRQGVFLPNAVKYVKEVTGVSINTSQRGTMSYWGLFWDIMNGKAARLKFGRGLVRKVAKLMGHKFFTEE